MRRKLVTALLASAVIGIAGACGSSNGAAFTDGDAGTDAQTPTNPPPIFINDGGSSGTSGSEPDGSFGTCTAGCNKGAHCKYDVCVPDLGSCATNDSCPGDSYCDTDKTCVPYGVPPGKINDPECARSPVPGVVEPTVQCEWAKPAAGDPTIDYVNVYTAPMVADLNLDLDPNKLQPSVVITTFADVPIPTGGSERIGMLRVFDGRTCVEQMNIGGPGDLDLENNRPSYGTQLAIGDLDGDVGTPNGHPEIVAMHRMPGALAGLGVTPVSLIAYAIDTGGTNPRLTRKWLGRNCTTGEVLTFGTTSDNYGPNIFDIDDDGKPEVIVDKNVFDQNGCLLNPPAAYEPYIQHGAITTIADVDLDGKPDLVRADGIYGWDKSVSNWVIKPWFIPNATTQKHGHIAVVDLGRYSEIPGHPSTDKLPEIVIVSAQNPGGPSAPKSTGTVRVQDLVGNVVFGPVPLYTTETEGDASAYYGGHGGPPTASDFDGDGYPEFATAANAYYTVYDPDCEGVGPAGGDSPIASATRPGGKCMRPSYMLPLASGPVPLSKGILWAQPSQDFSSSETGSSIFDFNGDGKSEAVYRDECYLRVYEGATGNVIFSAPAGSGTGQEMPVICDADGDFATEIVVVRAQNGPSCPATDPLAPDSGAPPFSKQGGFLILRDPLDRWLASRPIWNQHAYSITNVNDNASIPKSSDVKRNWEQPGLNNFRQNTQGALGKLALADLTAQISDLSKLCGETGGAIALETKVCNRGTNPVQDGVTIAFYTTPKGSPLDASGAAVVCQTTTPKLLKVGECVTVSCTGNVPAGADVYVVTDPAGKVADCHPGNNNGASARVLCPVVK